MGLFDFIKNAGAKILGKDDEKLDAGRGLSGHLRDHGIDPGQFKFTIDGDTVVVEGRVADQETREKAVLIIGNVEGVAKVDDRIAVGPAVDPAATAVADAAPLGGSQTLAHGSPNETGGWSSRTYTVEKGDTLSAISKKMYGNANKYNVIFEANKPMLAHPDKIYPGQVLRIPPLAD